jgi:predicted membrane protein
MLAFARFTALPSELKRMAYFIAAIFVQVGIFSTRWNVVIGGQLFSKSFRGLTAYKLEIGGQEGLLIALGLLILPFFILYALLKLFPPWDDARTNTEPTEG